MKNVSIGSKASEEIVVGEQQLAVNVGSGSLEVLATPIMAALMEKAACKCISDFMENDETTVGTELNISHVSPTPAGMKVIATAEVTSVNGREIAFKVSASDECGVIGSGTHKRFLVYGEKFMRKANAKRK